MRTLRATIAILGLLLGALGPSGCIIDPVPLPEAERNDDSSGGFDSGADTPTAGLLNTSAVYFSATTGPLLVVGIPGATAGVGTIDVVNDERSFSDRVDTAPDGSFNLLVDAVVGDTLELTYRTSFGVFATGTVLLAPPSQRAEENSDAIGGALDTSPGGGECTGGDCGAPPPPSATQSDSAGYTVVTLEPGRLVPGAPVVVANITRGNSAMGYARVDGGASIPISASSGDALDVFGVDIGTNGGGEATRIDVP